MALEESQAVPAEISKEASVSDESSQAEDNEPAPTTNGQADGKDLSFPLPTYSCIRLLTLLQPTLDKRKALPPIKWGLL